MHDAAPMPNAVPGAAAVLFTTGYAGFDHETFLWKLRRHQIQVVVDVRNHPVSRNRHFTKSRLQPFLQSQGIEYVGCPELGAPAELRQGLRQDNDLAAYLAGYRVHLATQPALLADLHHLATSKTCCLLCLERDPAECHRSALAEELAARPGPALSVVHV